MEIEVSDSEAGGIFFDPRLDMELDGDPLWFDDSGRGGRGRSGQRKKKVRVREARRILVREEANKLLDFDQVVDRAVTDTEENGLVFIDEIDKLCGPKMDMGRDVSGEGVQRDMLPLLEGTTVMTRYGPLSTEHILFIAAGTFSQNKPSDLIPELQGRFPLRVELNPLTQHDFERILTEPRNSLTNQYKALLDTEGVTLEFAADGIRGDSPAGGPDERTDGEYRRSEAFHHNRETSGGLKLHCIGAEGRAGRDRRRLRLAAGGELGQGRESEPVYIVR